MRSNSKQIVSSREETLKCSLASILALVGNVDHSIGNGVNSAKTRGELLNDIRTIASNALKDEASKG